MSTQLETDLDELDFDWLPDFNPSTAAAELDVAINRLKSNYFNDYKVDEPIDLMHKANYYQQLSAARSAALSDLPSTSAAIDSWIEKYLDRLDIYSINSLSLYKEKSSDSGTLFEEEKQEQHQDREEQQQEKDFEPAVVWGTVRETEYDRVMGKYKARLIKRGLSHTVIEDWMSWANEQYAALLGQHAEVSHTASWYAQRLVWMMNDLGKHRRTEKYKNSSDREVEMIYMQENNFPVEEITVEHIMTGDQYAEELKKTQLKTWNDCIDWAQTSEPDEPMPKKLKQRVARLPKTEGFDCLTVERVTTYNDQYRGYESGWDLRDKGEVFPVKTRRKARITVNGYVKGDE